MKLKIADVIENVEKAKNISEIPDLKKMQGKNNKDFYRIKINDYRISVKIESDLVIFVRFKHRKDIYKVFP